MNILKFEEICKPHTINYLRRMNEIDNRIDETIIELLKIEKLKISTTDNL